MTKQNQIRLVPTDITSGETESVWISTATDLPRGLYMTKVETGAVFHISVETAKQHIEGIFRHQHEDLLTLGNVIVAQRSALEYGGFYNAFLLDQLPEDDFQEISKNYVIKREDIDPKGLARKIQVVLNYTNLAFSTSDLADIFSCHQENVENASAVLENEPKPRLTAID